MRQFCAMFRGVTTVTVIVTTKTRCRTSTSTLTVVMKPISSKSYTTVRTGTEQRHVKPSEAICILQTQVGSRWCVGYFRLGLS